MIKKLTKIYLLQIGFLFVFANICASIKNQVTEHYTVFDNLNYDQTVKESIDSLRNFLILLDENIAGEKKQVNNFDPAVAFQQLEIINKELIDTSEENIYCNDLTRAFFDLCNIVKNIKILQFKDKRKILKIINNIKKIYISSKNAQLDSKQKNDFLFDNIESLSELIKSVLLTQKIKFGGFGAKISDIFFYRPLEIIADHKTGVIIITSVFGSLAISGALFLKFLKKEKKICSDATDETDNTDSNVTDVITDKVKPLESNLDQPNINSNNSEMHESSLNQVNKQESQTEQIAKEEIKPNINDNELTKKYLYIFFIEDEKKQILDLYKDKPDVQNRIKKIFTKNDEWFNDEWFKKNYNDKKIEKENKILKTSESIIEKISPEIKKPGLFSKIKNFFK
ncbi:MAG: hypothetical protein WC436_01820 [Candidatus Babeliales bacterium]